MADSLGELFIALCLDSDDFHAPVEIGFKPWMLQDENCKAAWDYCVLLKAKGGSPSKDEIAAKFKIDVSIPKGDSFEAVFRRLRTRSFSYDLKDYLEQGTRLIAKGEPEEALKILLQASKLKGRYAVKGKTKLSYRDTYFERLLYYQELKESGGYLGALTRWESWNRETKGFINGLFYVIAAMTSTGKSWLLMLILEDLLLQRRKPLIVSTEMAPERLQLRLDCLKYRLPYIALRDGSLTEEEELRWQREMFEFAEDKESSDAIFLGKKDVSNVQEVQLIAQDLGCTDVLIDGGYRLTNSREWGDQAAVVEGLQIAAEDSDIPWTTTVQLGDSSEKGKGFEAKFGNRWNIRYAKEWLIDPDVVVLMSQNKDLKSIKQMQLEFAKLRDGDGKPKHFRIRWNPGLMDYSEVSDESEEEDVLKSLESIGKGVDY